MLAQPSFGRRLRQLREQQGMPRTDVTGPGMSAAYLSRLESGARPPTERAVRYLTERLGVPVEAFSAATPSGLVDVLAAVMAAPDGDSDVQLRRVLEGALAHAENVDVGLRWQAHAQLAKLLCQDGEREAERDNLVTLVRLSDELGDAVLQVYSRLRLARCERALGAIEDARLTARTALSLSKDAALTNSDVSRCQLLLASVTAELGDLAEAYRLSEGVCDQLGDQTGPLAAEAFWTAATLSTRQGNHTRSAALLERAMEVLDSRENHTLWMRLRLAAAALTLQALPPDLEGTQRYLDEVRPALDLVGNTLHEQEYAFLRAQLAFAHGNYEQATVLCEEASHAKEFLNFRDRVRLEMLQEQIRVIQADPEADERLKGLAGEARSRGMLDLAAEVWQAVAETSSVREGHHQARPGHPPRPAP